MNRKGRGVTRPYFHDVTPLRILVNATAATEVTDLSKNDGRISAAVRVNGELRSTATDLPADACFPIYSITKTLTAICVLRSAEIGLLRLGDAARQWLPEVNLPATITLTHSLRHTSGLHDYGPLPEYHQAVRTHPDQPWTRQQFLDAVLSKGLLFAPGESWAYSNVGYMLLIDILERVTGRTFDGAFRSHRATHSIVVLARGQGDTEAQRVPRFSLCLCASVADFRCGLQAVSTLTTAARYAWLLSPDLRRTIAMAHDEIRDYPAPISGSAR